MAIVIKHTCTIFVQQTLTSRPHFGAGYDVQFFHRIDYSLPVRLDYKDTILFAMVLTMVLTMQGRIQGGGVLWGFNPPPPADFRPPPVHCTLTHVVHLYQIQVIRFREMEFCLCLHQNSWLMTFSKPIHCTMHVYVRSGEIPVWL